MSLGPGRWVRGADEVVALADFNGKAIAEAGQSGYLHPGDVFHRTFGGNKHLDPSRFLYLWEDSDGVAAWLMLQPRHGGWDLQVRPDLRDPELEADLTDWSFGTLLGLLAELETQPKEVIIDAFADDAVRVEALEGSGWIRGDSPYFMTERSTAEPLEGELAGGYTIRPALGIEEADAIGELHSAAFGSNWAPGEYARYMSNPGYHAEHELLAVAPDGSLAAFTVVWIDRVSGRGLFEPVGTHPDHRKLGLGRAVMAAGINLMAAAGLHTATVMFEGDNPGSKSLYLRSGFEVSHELIDYSKPLP